MGNGTNAREAFTASWMASCARLPRCPPALGERFALTTLSTPPDDDHLLIFMISETEAEGRCELAGDLDPQAPRG